MKLLPKSGFMKLHFFLAGFTLVSVLTGLALNYGLIPGYTIRSVHFYSGLLIVLSPSIALIFMKKRRQLLNAFKALAFINNMDIKRKRYVSIVSKLLLNFFILGLLKQLITGILIGLEIFITPSAVNLLYEIHTAGLLLLPVLLILHAVLMILAKKSQAARPVKSNINA